MESDVAYAIHKMHPPAYAQHLVVAALLVMEIFPSTTRASALWLCAGIQQRSKLYRLARTFDRLGVVCESLPWVKVLGNPPGSCQKILMKSIFLVHRYTVHCAFMQKRSSILYHHQWQLQGLSQQPSQPSCLYPRRISERPFALLHCSFRLARQSRLRPCPSSSWGH